MKKEWETCKDETVLVRVLKKDWEKIKEIQKLRGGEKTLMTTLHNILKTEN